MNDFNFEASVVALGAFDGLHLAHRKIMDKTKEYAKANNLASGVLLFDKLPSEVFSRSAKCIMSFSDKKELLSDMDFLYVQEFSEEFQNLNGEEFAEFLALKLKAKAVCAGFNYRFGKNAACDISDLERFGEKYGFLVLKTEELKVDGKTVSSTYIRELIEAGEMQEAAKLLGRIFFMTGEVLSGFHLGRTFGYPTVNLSYEKNSVLPKHGVYKGEVEVLGKRYRAVINVGKRPTFDRDDITIESFLLDFEGDLYGKKIRVYFEEFLRPEIKFKNAEELAKQIESDIKKAKKGF